MNINPVNNPEIKETKSRRITFGNSRTAFTEALDTFVKKQETKTIESFNLVEKFKEAVDKIFTKDNFINKGEHGQVFKVNDFWVVKLPLNEQPVVNNVKLNTDGIGNKLKTYYGDTIAEFGNVELMKNASGGSAEAIPAGVSGSLPTLSEQIKYYNDIYLEKFVSLPQSAFDNIASDFKTLNSIKRNGKYLEFDTINPNNFVAAGNEIRIMDKLEETTFRDPNSVAKMINVFTNSFTHDTPAVFDSLAAGKRKTILKKCLLAGEKAELPYGWSQEEKNYLKEALTLSGINEEASEIQRTLMNNRRKYPDIAERLKADEEYINSLGEEDLMFNTAHFFE